MYRHKLKLPESCAESLRVTGEERRIGGTEGLASRLSLLRGSYSKQQQTSSYILEAVAPEANID